MAIQNIIYPVTEINGLFSNIFPSQRRLNLTATRKDSGINSISSGLNGVVRIETDTSLTGIVIGDFISWGTDSYTARSSRVIDVISPTTIEVDEVFISTDVTNAFLNFQKDWFLEIRYVLKDSVTDDQNAVTILDFNSQVSNSRDGSVEANISVPYVFLEPSLQLANGFNNGLFVEYKIQFRESFLDNRDGAWISPTPDQPIMLVHASQDVTEGGFSDFQILKRYVRGYPVVGSFILSNVNDGAGGNRVTLNQRLYSINKTLIEESVIAEVFNFNGVFIFSIDTTTFDPNAVFLELNSEILSDIGQYDPTQYDPAQYS